MCILLFFFVKELGQSLQLRTLDKFEPIGYPSSSFSNFAKNVQLTVWVQRREWDGRLRFAEFVTNSPFSLTSLTVCWKRVFPAALSVLNNHFFRFFFLRSCALPSTKDEIKEWIQRLNDAGNLFFFRQKGKWKTEKRNCWPCPQNVFKK